jgi:hypothetical protein
MKSLSRQTREASADVEADNHEIPRQVRSG